MATLDLEISTDGETLENESQTDCGKTNVPILRVALKSHPMSSRRRVDGVDYESSHDASNKKLHAKIKEF